VALDVENCAGGNRNPFCSANVRGIEVEFHQGVRKEGKKRKEGAGRKTISLDEMGYVRGEREPVVHAW